MGWKRFRRKYKFKRLLRGSNFLYGMMIYNAIRESWPSIKVKLENAKDAAGNTLINDPEIGPLYSAIKELGESLER
jgi:hypothetical protein